MVLSAQKISKSGLPSVFNFNATSVNGAAVASITGCVASGVYWNPMETLGEGGLKAVGRASSSWWHQSHGYQGNHASQRKPHLVGSREISGIVPAQQGDQR